jgi:hypothetical protein
LLCSSKGVFANTQRSAREKIEAAHCCFNGRYEQYKKNYQILYLFYFVCKADATSLSYAALQAATAIGDVRELENLIISCIYAGVLSGKVRILFDFFFVILFAQTR